VLGSLLEVVNVAIFLKIHFIRMMRSFCRWGSFYGVY